DCLVCHDRSNKPQHVVATQGMEECINDPAYSASQLCPINSIQFNFIYIILLTTSQNEMKIYGSVYE
ncbi:hypothetical protein V6S75_33005, partial [Burkholderia pseudomallei]|uniref:hypothetical protein n=1 Tax=Burkholderia pseudomallei TaxID=28450 RepID=UPI00345A3863